MMGIISTSLAKSLLFSSAHPFWNMFSHGLNTVWLPWASVDQGWLPNLYFIGSLLTSFYHYFWHVFGCQKGSKTSKNPLFWCLQSDLVLRTKNHPLITLRTSFAQKFPFCSFGVFPVFCFPPKSRWALTILYPGVSTLDHILIKWPKNTPKNSAFQKSSFYELLLPRPKCGPCIFVHQIIKTVRLHFCSKM